MSKFQLRIEVHHSDIDEMGHVNNVVYLQWVQDVALAHWKSVSGADDDKVHLWVTLRHEIDYRKEIKPEEEIIAETWVASMVNVALPLMVPPITASPTPLLIGMDSPVIMASFTWLWPSRTVASMGIASPARTKIRSPTAICSIGRSIHFSSL